MSELASGSRLFIESTITFGVWLKRERTTMMRGSKLPLLLRVLCLKRKDGRLIKSARWVFVLLNSISPSIRRVAAFCSLVSPLGLVSANINAIKASSFSSQPSFLIRHTKKLLQSSTSNHSSPFHNLPFSLYPPITTYGMSCLSGIHNFILLFELLIPCSMIFDSCRFRSIWTWIIVIILSWN